MTTINNKEVAILEKEVTPTVNDALTIVIENGKDMMSATEILSTLNKYGDIVKEKKEAITKPLNASLKAVRDMFRPLEEKIAEPIAHVRGEMSRYQMEEMERVRKEEQKLVNRIGDGKGKLQFETAGRKMEEIERPDAVVEGKTGSIKFREDQDFEVMDMTLLPIEYVVADMVKIRRDMKDGKKVAGVRYFTKMTPVNSR